MPGVRYFSIAGAWKEPAPPALWLGHRIIEDAGGEMTAVYRSQARSGENFSASGRSITFI